MEHDREDVLRVMRPFFPERRTTPPAVSIERAMADGQRVVVRRRAFGATAVAGIAALAIFGAFTASGNDAARSQTVPGTVGSTQSPGVLPSRCTLEGLQLPPELKAKTNVHPTRLDSSGRFLVGQVAGLSDEAVDGILWDNGKPTRLSFPGIGQMYSDVNAAGVVVGHTIERKGDGARAMVLSGGKLSTLSGGALGMATAINDAGVIVGIRWDVKNGPSQPVRWDSATSAATVLPLPSGAELAGIADIGEDGTIIGNLSEVGGRNRGYVWQPDGTGRALPMPKLPDGQTAGSASLERVHGEWIIGVAFTKAFITEARASTESGTIVVWNTRTWQARTIAELTVRDITNAGLMVGSDQAGQPVLQLADRRLELAGAGGGTGNSVLRPYSVSDDGKVVAGQRGMNASDGPVLWRCS